MSSARTSVRTALMLRANVEADLRGRDSIAVRDDAPDGHAVPDMRVGHDADLHGGRVLCAACGLAQGALVWVPCR